MGIKKVATGWQVDVRPAGRDGKRLRRTFPRKIDAEQWERKQKVLASEGDWVAPSKDRRRLSDVADLWYRYHGHTLSNGARQLQQLQATCTALGNPFANDVDLKKFLQYRQERLDSGISANHLNHELTYLKSAFNELIRINEWQQANPFGKIKKLTLTQRELVFLTLDEVSALLLELHAARNPHVKLVAKICLSTGCRWGEAEGLRGEQIHSGQIHLTNTKNRRNRSIPIAQELEQEIFSERPRRGPLFGPSEDAFAGALDRAGIALPRGQKTHVLRHTFASHFMMSGGNLLDLNKILGHQTIQMTMTYAHLAPEHLAEAKHRNPIKQIEEGRRNRCGHNVDTGPSSSTLKLV